MSDALVAREGCAGVSTRHNTDRRRDRRDSSPRRSAPPLRTPSRVAAAHRQYDLFRAIANGSCTSDRLSTALHACDEYGLRNAAHAAIQPTDERHSEGEPT